MAIPCGACGQPVHEHAVKCPHCSEHTGIEVDRTISSAEAAAVLELARIEADTFVPTPNHYAGRGYGRYDPEVALVSGAAVVAVAVGAVIKSAVEAAVEERAERRAQPELPRATARARTAPVHLEPTVEPEPAPPPSDTPRFLK